MSMPTSRRAVLDNRSFTFVVWAVVGLGAVVMGLMTFAAGDPGTALLAAVLAALPVGPIVGLYLWLDRYEPEPRRLLIAALAWGAFGATVVALALQAVTGLGLGVPDNEMLAVVAPLTEEGAKGFFLLLLLWWRRHEIDGVLDGIVYAGLVGVGFAFVENILYLGAAYSGTDGLGDGGPAALSAIFVMRCLLSPFAHPLFTTFTGLGVGIAVASRSRVRRVVAPVVGYSVAVSTHAIWNSSTIVGTQRFFSVYLFLMAPALIAMMALAVWSRRSEKAMLQVALSDAARRGLIAADEVVWLTDLRARRQARTFAGATGGRVAAQAMKDYQAAAIELGFLHHRYLRGTAPKDFAARGQEFVHRMYSLRSAVQFPRGGRP